MQVFVANAWICAQRATDRDLESVFVKRKVNAWICAQSTTDRDLECVFNVNAWICARHSTDRDLESVFVKRKVNAWIRAKCHFLIKTVTSVTSVFFFLRIYCFRFYINL